MCSGVMADGSLRIVRNGIGMIEQVGHHSMSPYSLCKRWRREACIS